MRTIDFIQCYFYNKSFLKIKYPPLTHLRTETFSHERSNVRHIFTASLGQITPRQQETIQTHRRTGQECIRAPNSLQHREEHTNHEIATPRKDVAHGHGHRTRLNFKEFCAHEIRNRRQAHIEEEYEGGNEDYAKNGQPTNEVL